VGFELSSRVLFRSWRWAAAALLYTGAICLALPVAPKVWFWLLPRLGQHVSRLIGLAGLAVVAGLAVQSWTVGPRNRRGALALMAAVAVAYALLLTYFYVGPAPAKKVHLIEYGALAYLAFNGVRVSPHGGKGAVLAGAYVLMAGALDEGIQALLPMRFFGVQDIIGNWLGSALGALAWVAVSANSPWRRGGSAFG
jgi:lysylphosphatidylglycerol synthetase-like protein (DUF2156 family)